ncbi:MAG TPA: DUF6599 family protein [Thermoanaerobaculia bacterium]|nr:DUF6599 family protein [Thermoanaerobaculia bacterium]
MLTGCGGDSARRVTTAAVVPPPAEESFTAMESPSLQFLPRQEEAAGWHLDNDPIVIPGNRLTSYMDQDASHFARYGVIDATIGNYTATAGGGFATVEIFRFPDFVKAFGAYSTRKEGTIQFLQIENEAFQSKHSIHLWRGPFYVRVIGGGTTDGFASMARLTGVVAERMPPAPARPAVFNFFPTNMRVANSERYSVQAGFGQTMLANSFQATFDHGGAVVQGLIIPAADKATATRIFDGYRALYLANGKLLDPITNLGEDNFTAEDRFLGRAVAFRIDRFVIAFNGYTDRGKLVDLAIATDTRILGSIRRQLVSADKEAAAAARTSTSATPWTTRP